MMKVANVLDPIATELPPAVWDHPASPEPILKPIHAHWITTHIYEILERGGYTKPHEWLTLYMTGSLCSYQYSDSSDVDVSLFVDAASLPEWSRAEMIGLMIKGVEGLTLPGTPYELQAYVVSKSLTPSDLYRPGLRAGYDIATHRWVSPPDRGLAHDVKAQENGSYVYALEVADKMHKLLEYEPSKAVLLWHQIHRKRGADEKMGKGDTAESNLAYKMLFKRGLIPQLAEISGEHIAKTAAVIPPEPGTIPIPPDHVRLWHYTGADPEQIHQQGILLNQAKGEQYGEPNQIWASARPPDLYNHNVVEFAAHRDDPRWDIGKYAPYLDYGGGVGDPNLDYGKYLHDRGAHVTFRDSIRPEEILAVHEPWHQHYRFLQQNYPQPSNEFDWALNDADPALGRAVQEWKGGGHTAAWTGPGEVNMTTQPAQTPMQQGPFSPYANVKQWQVNIGWPSNHYDTSDALRNMMFENHPQTPFQIQEGKGGWEGKPEKSMALHLYDTPHDQMQAVMHTVGRHFPDEEMFGIMPSGYESGPLWENPYHKSKRGGVASRGTSGFGPSSGSKVIEVRSDSQPISVRSDLPDGRFRPLPVAASGVVALPPFGEQEQPVAFGSSTHGKKV